MSFIFNRNNSNLPKQPKNISVWELVEKNYISENDIDERGKVSDTIYQRALHQYNNFSYAQTFNNLRNSNPLEQRNQNRHQTSFINTNNVNRKNVNTNNVNTKKEDKEMCCICWGKQISHVFMPCFHLCTCVNCAYKVTRCPKCRTQIDDRNRVYF